MEHRDWYLNLSMLLITCSAVRAEVSDIPDTTVIIDPVNAPWIFVPIGPDNVTQLVLTDEQPWVLHFHSGVVYQPFRDTVNRLRGLVQFGLVHRSDRRTAELLKMAPDSVTFRSLPFGSQEVKLTRYLDTDVFDLAVDHASASVTDDSITRLTDEASLKRLLAQAVEAKPSKFTVLFTVRDATPTLLHRVLSKKLSRVYNFGLVARANPARPLASVGLGDHPAPIPGLLVLQPKISGSGGVGSLEITRLDESGIANEDELVFAEALRFLVEYNRQFRADLPGNSMAGDAGTVRLTGLLQRERLAFNVVDWAEQLELMATRSQEQQLGQQQPQATQNKEL